jgi:nucleoside-diphosphate-sugar epimerase
MRVTVLGAAGGLGAAISGELVSRGHAVTAVTRRGDRGPVGVERSAADLLDRASTTAATDGADVVVMAAQPAYTEWFSEMEPMVGNVLAAVEQAGARLVFVDNLYMYGPPDGPITEETPERPNNEKMALRRDLGRRLLAAHAAGIAPVSIGRVSDYYGPGGTNSLLYMLMIAPALAGKRMHLLVDGDQPHTFAYLPDAARAFARLVEHPEGDGRAWILPSAPALTQRKVAGIVNELLPEPAKVATLTSWILRLGAPFNSDAREGLKVAHQFDRPFVVDASGFERAFGAIELTDHRTALRETIAWARAEAAAPVS